MCLKTCNQKTSEMAQPFLKALTVIRIEFFLVILMDIQPPSSRKLRIISPKVNFLDIFVTSPQYFYKESMGTR